MKRFRSLAMVLLLLVVALLASRPSSPAAASEKTPVAAVNAADGTGLKGYDPVGYFTLGQPTPGVDQYTYSWKGVTYRFASAENLARFKADPEKYLPQYGDLLCLCYGDKPHCRYRPIPMGDRRWQTLFEQ